MVDFFVFPFKFEDILEQASDSRYWISTQSGIEELDDRHIKRKLIEIEKAIFDDYFMIKDSDRFDFLYFWIKTLQDKIESYPMELIEITADLLVGSVETIMKQMEGSEILEQQEDLRNSFKMIVFLLFFFLKSTRIKKGKNSIRDEFNEAAQNVAKNDKKKTKAKSRKDLPNESIDRIIKKQRNCILIIQNTLSLDFKTLWGRRQIESELFKYYVETGLTMLESKPLLKEPDVKLSIFAILEFVLEESPEALKNVQIKLINLIYEDENIVDPIADFIIKGYGNDKSNMVKLSTETLMMLVNYVVEKTNVNNEGQAVKNTKEFLCKVSEKIPKLFYNNLSSFIALYDSEAYLLRNALSEIISNIIKKVLTNADIEDDSLFQENHKNMKKKLLDRLIQRVYDKHAFCRSNILSILSTLCEENTIPRNFLLEIFKKACDRIKDVSAHVRKKAIQLLNITIHYYFVIFVESQNAIPKKFMTFNDLKKEINENKQEEEDKRKSLEDVEQEMLNTSELSNENLEELQGIQNGLKRKLEQIVNLRKYLLEYREILEDIKEICPNLEQLLGSKNQFDVLETMKLLTFMFKCNIESSKNAVTKMMVLIWTKDKPVKEELLKSYWLLYFDPNEFNSKQIALNMIKLLMESTLTEATSLEELLNFMLDWNNNIDDKEKEKEKKKDLFNISSSVFQALWDTFLNGMNGSVSKVETRCALQLLRICQNKNKDILSLKVDSFYNILSSYSKKNSQNVDWIIVKEISLIIEKMNEKTARSNQIIKLLMFLLITFQGTKDTEYFSAAEQIINMIFALKKNDADSFSQYLIKKMTGFLFDSKELENKIDEELPLSVISNNFEDSLAQLIFIIGHVAIKFLVFLDNHESELKRKKTEAETKYQADQKENPNEDLDKIQGGLEAEFEKKIEFLHQISEKHLLQNNLLSLYVPWIQKIARDILEGRRKGVNEILDRTVLLTLCKFMCVSGEFCRNNLDLLFKLMNSNSDSVIKNNIIISLGDLMHRYPNIIEPFTNNVYQNLRDLDPSVRKTTLLVITHLILNDMLKLKGEICDVALLLEDSDNSIQNLVKLFFHELHKKDSKLIYNLLPESIGRMSKIYEINNSIAIDEHTFQNFARNIMPYLEKDKYSESLVEKLCARFKNTTNEKEWRNTAYCLSLLPYNEKGLRKLTEMFENYREKLFDPQIMECFKSILQKFKKNRSELKNLVEEFESKLANFRSEPTESRRKLLDKFKKKPSRSTNNNNNTNTAKKMQIEEVNDKNEDSQKIVNPSKQLQNEENGSKNKVREEKEKEDKTSKKKSKKNKKHKKHKNKKKKGYEKSEESDFDEIESDSIDNSEGERRGDSGNIGLRKKDKKNYMDIEEGEVD